MTDEAADKMVGYKRPPLHSRFQPGASGNPRGRQKGVRNFTADVKRTLEIPVTLSENGKSKRVSTRGADAASAREALLSLVRTHDEGLVVHNEDTSLAAEDQAILDAYLDDALARRSQSHGGGATIGDDEHKGEEEGQ